MNWKCILKAIGRKRNSKKWIPQVRWGCRVDPTPGQATQAASACTNTATPCRLRHGKHTSVRQACFLTNVALLPLPANISQSQSWVLGELGHGSEVVLMCGRFFKGLWWFPFWKTKTEFNSNQVEENAEYRLSWLLSHREISKLIFAGWECPKGRKEIVVFHESCGTPWQRRWCFMTEVLTLLQSLRIHFYLVSRRTGHHSATSRLSWCEPRVAPLPPSCFLLGPLLLIDACLLTLFGNSVLWNVMHPVNF